MNRNILIGAAVLAILGAIAWWQLGGERIAEAADTEAANAETAAELADVDTSGIVEMTMGPEDAPVTMVEYASFTCPHCADFHSTTFQQVKQDYIDTGKIRYVYRDVFFDGAGLRGSMLARCAGPTRFFGIADLLYDKQREWLDAETMGDVIDNLTRIGKVAGLSEEQITACLGDQDKAKALEAWFRQNAEEDGITSTPTILVDGEAYGNPRYDELQAVLDEKLNQ